MRKRAARMKVKVKGKWYALVPTRPIHHRRRRPPPRPLTEAQKRRRQQSRRMYRKIEIAYDAMAKAQLKWAQSIVAYDDLKKAHRRL